jgi:hypothetical protein
LGFLSMTEHNEISTAQERTTGPVEHVAQIGLIVLLVAATFEEQNVV